MSMNVNLTPELETLVRLKVASGMSTSTSEVVREGLASGPGEPWDPEAVKQQVRARRSALEAAAKA